VANDELPLISSLERQKTRQPSLAYHTSIRLEKLPLQLKVDTECASPSDSYTSHPSEFRNEYARQAPPGLAWQWHPFWV